MYVGSRVFLWGQPRPRPNGSEPQRHQNFMATVRTSKRFDLQATKFGMVTHVGVGWSLPRGVSHAPIPILQDLSVTMRLSAHALTV